MLVVLWLLILKSLVNMLYLPNDEFFVNKFVETKLPTKAQIFSRTGQRSVNPAGAYTGDTGARIGMSPTQTAQALQDAYESAESKPAPDDLPED